MTNPGAQESQLRCHESDGLTGRDPLMGMVCRIRKALLHLGWEEEEMLTRHPAHMRPNPHMEASCTELQALQSSRCKMLWKAMLRDSPLFQFRVFQVNRAPGTRSGRSYGVAVISRKPSVRHEGVGCSARLRIPRTSLARSQRLAPANALRGIHHGSCSSRVQWF